LAPSNRDRIGRALEILGDALAPFVDRHMAAFLSQGRDWLEVMAERARREGRPDTYYRSDARVLLQVITQNPGAFRKKLSRLELAYARETAEIANRWAHLEPFTDDDTSRALDTMARLLRAAGAEAQAGQLAELLPARPADHQGPHDTHAAGGRDQPSGAIEKFRDRDGDYLAWVAAHGTGYVINVGRSGGGLAVLHRASCGTITSRPPLTASYIKVCSPSLGPLDEWARERNGSIAQRCGICRPPRTTSPAATPAEPEQGLPGRRAGDGAMRSAAQEKTARQPRTSKYDPLRDFLASRKAAPIILTFTQIDQLVGTLPPSARAYHLWWRDDDPSHHHCRSWNDAGYTAHPDFDGQQVTFLPRTER
jgi:hypothetical protein